MIDLHLHTTASDGRSTPADLVREAHAAGIRTMAVTDHDTVAGVRDVRDAATAAGVDFVPGIEITAVHGGRDVHVLGYFIDASDPGLAAFLSRQRADRRRRVVEIGDRLARLGVAVNTQTLLTNADANPGRSLGRPLVAAALVAAGHAENISDAFNRFLGEGQPAFVERSGVSVADVIAQIRQAGGLSSLAHPGKLRQDELIPGMATAGLTAIEVFHPDHEPEDAVRYAAMAQTLGLLVTGGSDYHGPGSGRTSGLGKVGLPDAVYRLLIDGAARVRPA